MRSAHILRKLAILSLLASVPSLAHAEWTASPTMYIRNGTGVNSKGGLQQCFNNPGTPGNEFRLGNECGSYEELGLTLSSKEELGLPFAVRTRLAHAQRGLRQWEDTDGDNRDISLIEGYGSAELANQSHLWIGKRFYRDVDAHLDDWYYYADSSGIGAGLSDIPFGESKLSVAHIFQGTDASSEAGTPVLQAVDLRLQKLPLSARTEANFWSVTAWSPATRTATAVDVIARHGFLAGTRLHVKLDSSWNDLSLIAGFGVLEGMNLYGDITVPRGEEYRNQAERYRLVDNLFWHVSDRLEVLGTAAAELRRTGAPGQHGQWLSLGVRPVFIFTDHFSCAVELGWSRVEDNSEVDGVGAPIGPRQLQRVTVAPQWGLKRGAWGRPVLRAFAAYSFWNSANRGYVARNSAYEMSRDGANFGYQFEFWF